MRLKPPSCRSTALRPGASHDRNRRHHWPRDPRQPWQSHGALPAQGRAQDLVSRYPIASALTRIVVSTRCRSRDRFRGTRSIVIPMIFFADNLRTTIAAGYRRCSRCGNNSTCSRRAMITHYPSLIFLQLTSHSFQLNTTWERSPHPGVDQLMVRSIIQRKQEGGQHD